MLGEPEMSLGYMRGNTWVVDTRYQAIREWEPFQRLVWHTSKLGFSWKTEYSYASKQYTTEIRTVHKHGPGHYSIVSHENAFDPHPVTSIIKALRKHGVTDPYCLVLILELECYILREKLLPMKRLESAIEELADTLTLGLF